MSTYVVRPLKHRPQQRGFTLIEIMVVVVILGLLMGLVAVNVLGRAEDARKKTAFAQMKSFEEALELYRLDFGNYPASGEGLEALLKPKGGEAYMRGGVVPKDPWNHDYAYIAPGTNGQAYEIISYGADGEPGGEGGDADIKNWQPTSEAKPEE